MNDNVQPDSEEAFNNFNALVKRTNKEKPAAADLEQLRATFDAQPWTARKIGNLQRNVFASVVDLTVGKSALMREAVNRYIKEMKADLNYDKSSFVEKMLIDEIIMRWVRLQSIEQSHANATTGRHSMAEAMYLEKRLHLAQKRHLAAIETLAKVRRMVIGAQAKGMEMFKSLMQISEAQAKDADI